MKLRPATLLALLALMGAGCATPPAPAWHALRAEAFARPLGIQDCLNLARENDLRQAQWRARSAEARAELATARAIPNPTFQAAWEDIGLKDATGAGLSTATYGFSYPVFFWWLRGSEVRGARSRMEQEEADIRAEQRHLEEEIGSAYFGVLGAERKAAVAAEVLAETKRAGQLASELYKLGAAAGRDVEVARVEEAKAEVDLFEARRDAEAQGFAFAFALGAERPIAPKLEADQATLPARLAEDIATSGTLPSEPLFAEAIEHDPACASAKAAFLAAEADLSTEQRRAVPLSEAQGSAGRKRDPEGRAWNLGFDVPIPLFDWNRGGIAKAQAALLAAQAREEEARRAAAARLTETWTAYQSARGAYRMFRERIAVSQAHLAVGAQDLFAAGEITYAELSQARRDWRESELAAAGAWQAMQSSAWRLLVETRGPTAGDRRRLKGGGF